MESKPEMRMSHNSSTANMKLHIKLLLQLTLKTFLEEFSEITIPAEKKITCKTDKVSDELQVIQEKMLRYCIFKDMNWNTVPKTRTELMFLCECLP